VFDEMTMQPAFDSSDDPASSQSDGKQIAQIDQGGVPDGCRAMNDREAIKVMVHF